MSSTKPFYEVFPTLKLEGEEKKLFSFVSVQKISTTARRDRFTVYIESPKLLTKELVNRV